MTKKTLKFNKGFSLIEILVALGIFSLIISTVMLFSLRSMQAHAKSEAMQSALENARFFIEKLNKKIRMSSNIDADDFSGADELFIIDNVDEYKYCYRFEDNKLRVSFADNESEADSCSHSDMDDFNDLIGSDKIIVDGRFFIKTTDEDDHRRGFVRTVLEIKYEKDEYATISEQDSVVIQSGVSLRDY